MKKPVPKNDSEKHVQSESLVSAVIPLYNGAEFIQETLASVYAQTYRNIEIIVVDDGSADEGPEIVEREKEKSPFPLHISWHDHRENRGIGATRQKAVGLAKGEFIAFIDADDIWLPHKIARQVGLLNEYPEAALVYSRARVIDRYGNESTFQGDEHIGFGRKTIPEYIFTNLLFLNRIPTSTVLARKAAVNEAGGFMEIPRYHVEDRLLWSKISLLHPVLYDPEITMLYRVLGSGHTSFIYARGYSEYELNYLAHLFQYMKQIPRAQHLPTPGQMRKRLAIFIAMSRVRGVTGPVLNEYTSTLQSTLPEYSRFLSNISFAACLIPVWCSRILYRMWKMIQRFFR
jgi:glycosyltransferase involved in cell wall biosynthesis